MTEHVKTEIAGGIMTLTLARPDKKNALSNAMYRAMSDGLERAEKDPAVRVVLFQGDGDSFTAGNDIADFSAQANGVSRRYREADDTVRQSGAGSGGSLELAVAGPDRARPRLRDVCTGGTYRCRDRARVRFGQRGRAGRRVACQGPRSRRSPDKTAGRFAQSYKSADARYGQDRRSNCPRRRVVSRALADQGGARGVRSVRRAAEA